MLKQADIKVHLLFESGRLICVSFIFFNSERETLTPGKDQRTPTSPAQVDKISLLPFYLTLLNLFNQPINKQQFAIFFSQSN